MQSAALPDPALVVLVGVSGSGKSTWARARYRAQEIVSSDDLRGVVGSGTADLGASVEALALLDQIVAARLSRGLTTVVDTLGSDADRRRAHLALARRHGLATVAVVFDAPPSLTRARNADRERPVPARALTGQHRRLSGARDELETEGWDRIEVVGQPSARSSAPAHPLEDSAAAGPGPGGPGPAGPEVILQLSRFPWEQDPLAWLRQVVLAADEAGFTGVALMDHLIQIPQVGRAWEPVPETWVTLGAIAGLGTGLRLGTLVSPVTFRAAGITAKAAATLDVISGGGAFLGIGAGWWAREHAAFNLAFPEARQRLDLLETAIETIRALWAAGTKPYASARVSLPETTCYPRPTSSVPIIVGGSGPRTLAIAGRLGDGCNVPSDEQALPRHVAALHRACDEAGRARDEVTVTVLDVPVVGRDRDDAWARVERLRGPTPAAVFAARHHAGTAAQHRERYARLRDAGVSTIFVAPGELRDADDVLGLAELARP